MTTTDDIGKRIPERGPETRDSGPRDERLTWSLIAHLKERAARLREEADRDRIFSEDCARTKNAVATVIEREIQDWLSTELDLARGMAELNCSDRTLRDKYHSTGTGRARRWRRSDLLTEPADESPTADESLDAGEGLTDASVIEAAADAAAVQRGVEEALRMIA